jgi:hypothetical protein
MGVVQRAMFAKGTDGREAEIAVTARLFNDVLRCRQRAAVRRVDFPTPQLCLSR